MTDEGMWWTVVGLTRIEPALNHQAPQNSVSPLDLHLHEIDFCLTRCHKCQFWLLAGAQWTHSSSVKLQSETPQRVMGSPCWSFTDQPTQLCPCLCVFVPFYGFPRCKLYRLRPHNRKKWKKKKSQLTVLNIMNEGMIEKLNLILKKWNSDECDIYFIDLFWGEYEYMCTNMYV